MKRTLVTLVLALIAMLMTVAAAPGADAQIGEYRCSEGRLVGDQCELVGPAPFVTTACPQASDIVQPGCHRLVLPLVDCPAPYVPDSEMCSYIPDPNVIPRHIILSDHDCPAGAYPLAVDPQFNGFFWEYARCLSDAELICPPPTSRHVTGDGVECRLAVEYVLSYVCEAGYQLDGLLRCVHYVPAELHFPTWGLGGFPFG